MTNHSVALVTKYMKDINTQKNWVLAFSALILAISPFTISKTISSAETSEALTATSTPVTVTASSTEQVIPVISTTTDSSVVQLATTTATEATSAPQNSPDLGAVTATASPQTTEIIPEMPVAPSEAVSSTSERVPPVGVSVMTPLATEPAFDPAIEPAKVKIRVLLENGQVPVFGVVIRYVAVGDKKIEVALDKNGESAVELPSGRYYGELVPSDNTYKLKGDGPAFFVEANTPKDLGTYYLMPKQ